ncbi:electron transport protein [Brevibacillus migulae]|uniref:electron transport protein n=1 Tax=Brevibacillus migulae TaxID=1644114 RepID=UPI001F18D14F|nr:electron transport protein [Brevibacillus migulae]
MWKQAKSKWILIGCGFFVLAGGIFAGLYRSGFEYVYTPAKAKYVNPPMADARIASQTSGVTVTQEMLALGEETYIEKTFGNERFFTDIMGAFDGPLSIPNILKAVAKLKGRGTTNLQVEAAKTATIGGKTIHKGQIIDTGIDVPKGVYAPLGFKIKWEEGRLKAGISCMACHATVDPRSGKILQGLPNRDFNMGYLLALSTNTTSYFTHTNITSLKKYITELSVPVTTSDGRQALLPDPQKLEDEVDRQVMFWPKGSVDVTLDSENNPVQIPDALTKGDHPFGWNGQGMVGPFKGASAGINNVHSQNMDTLSQTVVSKPMLGIDKEVYLGTVLQRAANPKYRYKGGKGKERPTAFFAKVDPTPGVAGINELYVTSTYPKANYISSVGLTYGTPGYHALEEINAMSAWMETLKAPASPFQTDAVTSRKGRQVFERAGCIRCHAGDYLTSNAVIPIEQVKTEPSRAKGFHKVQRILGPPLMYTEDTPLPIPPDAKKVKIPITEHQRQQLKIAWAQSGSRGGYKTMSLLGLAWSAPYLHDGGVAVGKDRSHVGLPQTEMKELTPDPYNSLLALVDKDLREKVIASNRSAAYLREAHVSGEGHAFWVDRTTGFTKEDQDALVRYLLSLP